MGVHPSLLWPLDFLFGPMRGQGSPPPRPAQAALHPRPQPEPKLPALVYSEDRPALRAPRLSSEVLLTIWTNMHGPLQAWFREVECAFPDLWTERLGGWDQRGATELLGRPRPGSIGPWGASVPRGTGPDEGKPNPRHMEIICRRDRIRDQRRGRNVSPRCENKRPCGRSKQGTGREASVGGRRDGHGARGGDGRQLEAVPIHQSAVTAPGAPRPPAAQPADYPGYTGHPAPSRPVAPA
ncbi:unnamed protein product [Rangifer tarandus platyrhynchus]|uniref:Uncharacterized protein n=1 Tax=Rangifer tarandus platyrhynchus TaxID=3082113 RepID=A0ABN8Y6R8_RANTA|nr:unnamed protein product [Rangifer tarandus platyrhynchus]